MPVLGILVDLNRSFRSHPSAEALEELALGRLPEAITGQIEEHLLLCRECQNTLAEIDTFISAFRAADANDPWEDLQRPLARRPGSVESEHDRAGIVTERFGWSLLPSIAMRKTSIAPVLVLATFVLLMIRTTPPDPQPPVGVSLTSMRTGADVFAQAPAGKPLRLSFDAPGLRVEEGSRLEIVDGAGSTVWEGSAARARGKLSAVIPKPLLRGVYWVRLYGANSELLQEYGLSAN